MNKTIRQVLSEAIKKLKENGIETPQLDAEILLAFVLDKPREFLIAHEKRMLSPAQISTFQSLISRHCLAEPVAYLTGHKEFFGLDFQVTKDTLIPRPETELLVEKALELLDGIAPHGKTMVIDVGTGSGNIIISVAKNIQTPKFPQDIILFAIEPSIKALEIAKQNATIHQIENQITFLRGNLLSPLISNFQFPISHVFILANLPYLSEEIYNSSTICVKNFEPKEALLSGESGLEHYNKLLNQLEMLAEKNKMPVTALFEISPEQKPLIVRRIKSQFPKAKICLEKDLAGKWRMLVMQTK